VIEDYHSFLTIGLQFLVVHLLQNLLVGFEPERGSVEKKEFHPHSPLEQTNLKSYNDCKAVVNNEWRFRVWDLSIQVSVFSICFS